MGLCGILRFFLGVVVVFIRGYLLFVVSVGIRVRRRGE